MNDLNVIYNAVQRMAQALTGSKDKPVLIEACDFGKSYGFTFKTPTIYESLFWCVDKKTFIPFTFIASQDFEMYENRKPMEIKQ